MTEMCIGRWAITRNGEREPSAITVEHRDAPPVGEGGIEERFADHDVAPPIAVQVTGASHTEAELGIILSAASGPQGSCHQTSGQGTSVAVDFTSIGTRFIGQRRAHEHIADQIVVHVSGQGHTGAKSTSCLSSQCAPSDRELQSSGRTMVNEHRTLATIPWCTDDDVTIPITIHIARCGNTMTKACIRQTSGHGPCSTAKKTRRGTMEHHHTAGIRVSAIVVVRHTYDDVAIAIAVHITRRGDTRTETLPRLHAIQHHVRKSRQWGSDAREQQEGNPYGHDRTYRSAWSAGETAEDLREHAVPK